MGMGIRIIGGAGDEALSIDSGSLLVKPYTPGSPYTHWMAPTTTATYGNAAVYWSSATGCRGFKAELAASATWTASQAYVMVAFDTADTSMTAILDEGSAAYASPAGTALPNTLYINSTVAVNSEAPSPVEAWVAGATRIKTIAMRAHAATRVKLTVWI